MTVGDDWEFEHWMFGGIKGTLVALRCENVIIIILKFVLIF